MEEQTTKMILEELKYIRKRLDNMYDDFSKINARISTIETKVDSHIFEHWKYFAAVIVVITGFVSGVNIYFGGK